MERGRGGFGGAARIELGRGVASLHLAWGVVGVIQLGRGGLGGVAQIQG